MLDMPWDGIHRPMRGQTFSLAPGVDLDIFNSMPWHPDDPDRPKDTSPGYEAMPDLELRDIVGSADHRRIADEPITFSDHTDCPERIFKCLDIWPGRRNA